MSKRPAEDDEDDTSTSKFIRQDDSDDGSDDGENYRILQSDDIEGQEDGVVTREGDIQITPFNMTEEMEEGHFDSEGMYHWNKEKEVRDNWLENIDWVKIKETNPNTAAGKESEFEDDQPFDEIPVYKQLLQFMRENETVATALRRLGGAQSLSASERLKRKKAGLSNDTGSSADAEAVTKLTELANNILTRTGNMDIYQETYKGICKKIENADKKTKEKESASAPAELDMYADDFNEKEESERNTSKNDESSQEQEIQWEYKNNVDDNEVHGPYSTEQMNKWMQENHFKTRIWVRKVGTDCEYYSSDRMDFELYL